MSIKKQAKQIIVIRKDLNMRKGKMVAQGSHASLGAVLSRGNILIKVVSLVWSLLTKPALRSWLSGSFTKVCVSVNSEQELIDVYNNAQKAGLISCLITDKGLTEFNGVPTLTCCAIGPEYSDEIDKITAGLKLL